MGTKRDLTEFDQPGARVIDQPMHTELEESYLDYSLAVIQARALPDARDGLKPVQRRVLFGAQQFNLRPTGPFMKCGRVVGEVMGKWHPHGDSAIYDAMVRMTQDFVQNTPVIDGHGNFGTLDDSAAASRYTECRMSVWGELMVADIGEETVDFVPNYDGSLTEPSVLPAALPHLLVNGSSGVAVGMATNMIPHNLTEALTAAKHLLEHPDASIDDLMRFLPGPDLPTGGLLMGTDGVRAAYETGRGKVELRARSQISDVPGSRGRQQISFTELPYGVGTEKVIEAIKKAIAAAKLAGVADVKDLTDRESGTNLVVEAKVGVNPEVLLAQLWRHTPLQSSFHITNLALVEGRPQQLSLLELLNAWLGHRVEVTRRRSVYRRTRQTERLHLVEGLLTALLDIDRVIALIRAADNAAAARDALMAAFPLSDTQTQYILDTPLRRLTKYDRLTLETEASDLAARIADLDHVLGDPVALRALVGAEIDEVLAQHPTPRRTTLVDGDLAEVLAESVPAPTAALELPDVACRVMLSTTGLLVRSSVQISSDGSRAKHDVFTSAARATTRGLVLAITSTGRAVRIPTMGIPETLGPTAAGGVPAAELVPLEPGEKVVALAPADGQGHGLALGTRDGVVKVQAGSWPVRGDDFPVIGLKGDDVVVAGAWMDQPEGEFAFVTSDAQLLVFGADQVRPQGAGTGGGVAGIRLSGGARVVAFAVVPPAEASETVLVSTSGASTKVTPLRLYPRKGRGTGGVRCQRFLKSEPQALQVAAVTARALACTSAGAPMPLPALDERRDGSGTASQTPELLGAGLGDWAP